jgi:hypothetical protein
LRQPPKHVAVRHFAVKSASIPPSATAHGEASGSIRKHPEGRKTLINLRPANIHRSKSCLIVPFFCLPFPRCHANVAAEWIAKYTEFRGKNPPPPN